MRSITVTAQCSRSPGSVNRRRDGPGLCVPGDEFRGALTPFLRLAPELLVANGVAHEGERVEFVLIAAQRKTVEVAAA